MLQGSTMTRSHKGMRRGISLIEMLMAIVLLGLLGGISYNYYKVYYDVAFAAKQAKVYVIIDQAVQVSGAHDLYTVKNGIEPTTMAAMVTDRQLIRIPDKIPEISAAGWVLNAAVDIDASLGGANDVGFTYAVDGTASNLDKLEYCNILTNNSKNTWSLDPTVSDDTAVVALANPATAYANVAVGNDYFCYGSLANTYHMFFVKRVDPS